MGSVNCKEKRVKKRNNFKFYTLLFTLLTLSGCWDLEEVDRRAFGTTVGIDINQRRQIILSFQVPIPQKMLPPGAGGNVDQGKNFSITSVTGTSVANAFRQLQTKTFRRLVIQQNKSIIIGEEAARVGVASLMDWLVRSPKAPPQALVFVTNGRSANEILKFVPDQKVLPGLEFIASGQSAVKYDRTYFIPVWKFEQKLLYESKDTYAPLIDIGPKQGNYRIFGLAVFNGYKMAGELDAKEAQAFGILTGRMSSGGMSFGTPEGQTITLRNVRGRTKIKVLSNGDQAPLFEVQSKVTAILNELTDQKTNLTPKFTRGMEQMINESLKQRLEIVISKLQAYNSDVIDFGEQFRVQHPELWENAIWKNVFPVVPYRITVKVSIQKDGVLR